MKPAGYFEEADGSRSMARLLAFLSFCIAAIISIATCAGALITGHMVDVSIYVIVLLSYSGGTKVIQKYAEVIEERKNENGSVQQS